MAPPLDGVTVVDFSQFLAGPYASLRLQDLGARVIKVENPAGGDLSRRIYLSDTRIGADSTLFHAINRGKESIALDLKSPEGLKVARRLVARADVVIQNFRPGVMDRLGLGFEAARKLRRDIIYGSVSGFGTRGDWAQLPGQDLLAQARSGIMWLSGNAGQGPVPIGLPIADISAGANLAQGILAALFHHARSGEGGLVETSLLESLIDLQFEFLTTWLNNGGAAPRRLSEGSAHGYLPAPYGVFETAEGYLALAMAPLERLWHLLELPALAETHEEEEAGFTHREEINNALKSALRNRAAAEWEAFLGGHGIWCARVLTWQDLLASGTVEGLDMLRPAETGPNGVPGLLGSPVRMNGHKPVPARTGPTLDAHGPAIVRELGL